MKRSFARSSRSSASPCADGEYYWNLSEGLVDRKISHEIKTPRSDEVLIAAHRRITEPLYKELVKAKVAQAHVSLADLKGLHWMIHTPTGEVRRVAAD